MSTRLSKEIWCEPVLGLNRERLVERCQDAILSGRKDSFIFLIPTRLLLERTLAQIIDRRRVQGCFELPVFLFDGLVRQILEEFKVERKLIDDATKYFLIEQVMGRLAKQGDLKYVPDIALMPGCVQSMGELIGEIKRAGKRSDEFRQFLQSFNASDRDADLAKIYEAYQNLMDRRRLMDHDDAYLLARDLLASKGLPERFQTVESLYIDGFFDFTPIQAQLLSVLITLIPEIIVNFNFDARNPQVFVPTDDTIRLFETLGFTRVLQPVKALPLHSDLELLATNLFNTEVETPKVTSLPPITILSAPDILREVHEIAKEIKRLVLEEGYQPSQIAIVMRDSSKYAETILRVFANEGIPCAMDHRERLTAIPSVKAALKLMKCRVGWEAIESFVALIKNDYIDPFCAISRDAVDNALAAVGIQLGTRDWLDRAKRLLVMKRHEAERVRERPVDPEEIQFEFDRIQRGITAIESAIGSILAIRDRLQTIPDRGTVAAFVSAFEEALKLFNLWARLDGHLQHVLKTATGRLNGVNQDAAQAYPSVFSQAEKPDLLRNERDLHMIARDLKGLEKMLQVMREVASVSGDSAIDLGEIEVAEFKPLLEHLLGRTEFRVELGDPQGVAVFEVTRSHALAFRAVFIAGLVEGMFPESPKRDWVYPYAERQKLADSGLFLQDLSPTLFQKKEEHLFYQLACQATDRLYLTFPRTLGPGDGAEETIMSSFIEEIRDLYQTGNEPCFARHESVRVRTAREESMPPVKSIISGSYDIHRTSTPRELVQNLLTSLWQSSRQNEGSAAEELLLSLYDFALGAGMLSKSLFARLAIEEARQGNRFGPFDGLLNDRAIQAQLSRQFGRERVYSTSQFNVYGSCAFQFFCKYVLRLDPREEASIDLHAVDRGRLLHEVLHDFLSKHTDQTLSHQRMDEYKRELIERAGDVFNRYEQMALPLHPQIWALEKQDIVETLKGFIENEIAYQEKVAVSTMRPHWLELGFGMKPGDGCHKASRRDYYTFKHGRDAIKIRGRIDRVDRSQDGKYIVYDHKTSLGSGVSEMRAGVDLQLPVYILALKKLFLKEGEELVGGGYYSIKEGNRNKGLYLGEYSGYTGISSRAESSLAAEEWQEILNNTEQMTWRYVEGMREGDFRVVPKLPIFCPRCNFKTICRYEKQRIRTKRE